MSPTHVMARASSSSSSRPATEHSPLLRTDVEGGNQLPDAIDWEDPAFASKSPLYLFLLTISLCGLQIVWSIEMSNGSPFLLSLGMSKSMLAFVWIAGPLSGALVQPYIGIRSDNCRISWGKRRPFMIFGGIVSILGLLTLAWTKEIVHFFVRLLRISPTASKVEIANIAFAVFFMYLLDFSLNTVQAGIRAFIVDNAPTQQQNSANAWAARVSGVGYILGYTFGYVDLPKHFPFFGNTQFKVLCVLGSMVFGSTLLVSCVFINERDPRLEGPPKGDNPGVITFFKQAFSSIQRLPPQIRKVCEVQFLAWIGWFPFLFYITTYIGQLYVNPHLLPGLPESDIDALWEEATRVGTFALLVYAITAFVCSILFPLIVVPSSKSITPVEARPALTPSSVTPASGSSPYFPITPSDSDSDRESLFSKLLARFTFRGITLQRLWLLSHILFAICMFTTFFITTPLGGIVLTALIGISWSLTIWAPFAIISAEVAHRDEVARLKRRTRTGANTPNPFYRNDTFKPNPEHDESTMPPTSYNPPQQHNTDDDEEQSDQAGIILGLHNVAISSPQILATLISSVVFDLMQKPRDVPGDDSIGMVLRIGGVAAIGAAWATSRLGEGVGEDDE